MARRRRDLSNDFTSIQGLDSCTYHEHDRHGEERQAVFLSEFHCNRYEKSNHSGAGANAPAPE